MYYYALVVTKPKMNMKYNGHCYIIRFSMLYDDNLKLGYDNKSNRYVVIS